MFVVEPYEIITGGMLTSSTIAEPDAGETVWTAGTYNAGDRRIMLSTHLLYECVSASPTTDAPDVGAAKAIPTWLAVSYTNRFRMFDQVNSSQSSQVSGPLIVEVTSTKGFNSVALFNVDGITSARFELHDSVGNPVYDKTLDAIDNSKVYDYWEYFNNPVLQRFKFFIMDMPKTANSTLKITINGNNIAIGSAVIGSTFNLGVALYGTSFRTVNLSKLEEDDFGNLVLVKRPNYLLVDYDISTDKDRLNFITQKLRKDLMNKPCVWAATDNPDDPTSVLGYYLDTQNNIDTPTKCSATIQVREIV